MSPSQSRASGGVSWFQPAPAWTAILILIALTLALLVAKAGTILRIAFPVGSFGIALFLYYRYPAFYLSFTWWIWYTSAGLARLADWQSGWDPQRVLLISPYLVTLVSGLSLVRYLPSIYRYGGEPFILSLGAALYGFALGYVQYPLFSVLRSGLDWIPPILWGLHLYVHWRLYPQFREALLQTFLWATLISGAYGVYQYLSPPDWDRQWIMNTEITSFGDPVPQGLRVFSIMHSPGPFSVMMMVGTLLLLENRSWLKMPAAIAGYLSFLLTMVRTCWGGWFLALLLHLPSLKSSVQVRLLSTIVALLLVVLPFTLMEPFSSSIGSRLSTLGDLKDDSSFNARSEIYESGLNQALSEIVGRGFGQVQRGEVVDSGVIETLSTLGWIGTIPYFLGVLLLLIAAFQQPRSQLDSFISIGRAACISILLQSLSALSTVGIAGMLLWSFLGMAAASRKFYHRSQRTEIEPHASPSID